MTESRCYAKTRFPSRRIGAEEAEVGTRRHTYHGEIAETNSIYMQSYEAHQQPSYIVIVLTPLLQHEKPALKCLHSSTTFQLSNNYFIPSSLFSDYASSFPWGIGLQVVGGTERVAVAVSEVLGCTSNKHLNSSKKFHMPVCSIRMLWWTSLVL